jgi:hypothetical protein
MKSGIPCSLFDFKSVDVGAAASGCSVRPFVVTVGVFPSWSTRSVFACFLVLTTCKCIRGPIVATSKQKFQTGEDKRQYAMTRSSETGDERRDA